MKGPGGERRGVRATGFFSVFDTLARQMVAGADRDRAPRACMCRPTGPDWVNHVGAREGGGGAGSLAPAA